MAFNPTREQYAAINTNGSVLVSAAAGSGKTAVLVERVMRLLTNPENSIPADKLLVVTYTNAAAAELRFRIEKRLSELLAENPGSSLLQKQKILINSANICTIDSFCINFIRENFDVSGVNPTFKVADRAVVESLQNTAMSDMFNQYFDENNENFLNLLRFFGDDYSDSNLRDIILRLYDFSRQIPYPALWLDKIVEQYRDHAENRSEEWFCDSMEIVLNSIEEAKLDFEQALKLLELSPTAYKQYSANYLYFYNLVLTLEDLANKTSWDEIFSLCNKLDAPKVGRLSSDEKTENFLQSVQHRDSGKNNIKKIAQIVYDTKDAIIKEINFVLPHIEFLVSLVKNFESRLYELFEEENVITFYLAEQKTFEMLTRIDFGEIVTSNLSDKFVSQFKAVLVDEYQDTNSLQDFLFRVISKNGDNLFCVGDVKQSIYRFRGANPTNFIAKKNEYSKGDAHKTRIDLGCNFRSRPEICQYINSVFSKIIYSRNSDFNYDEKEMLVPMASYPDNNECKVENHFLDFNALVSDSEDEYDAKIVAEAELVANIVAETLDKEPFLRDGETLRKAELKDITILVRSMQSKGDIYINALKKRGIPVSASAADIIDSDEVKTLISILKIINNPSDDIALLTVMTSPIFAFSMDEIAEIRTLHKYGKIVSSVIVAANNGNNKAKDFLDVIESLRHQNIVLSVGQLIEEIFDRTNLLNILSSTLNGDVKRLNLLGALNVANLYEEDGRKGLHSFINYFESLDNRDFKVSGAVNSNCVTVMSIHKSKGLQFPICIIANTSNRFNLMDVSNSVAISEKYGFSSTYFDENELKNDSFILKTIMKNDEKKQLLAEELRVCYVAMTRAEEKLITVSSYNDLQSEVLNKLKLIEASNSTNRVAYSLFKKNLSYADWILESLLLDGKKDSFSGGHDPSIIVHRSIDISVHEKESDDISTDNMTIASLNKTFSYKYPFSELLKIESKSSVTNIVHKADEGHYIFKTRPAFMHQEGLSSAERGIALHKVMQHADFSACKEDIKAELERLYEFGYLTENEFEIVDADLISNFVNSELCNRIINSKYIKREMKFLTEFDVSQLTDSCSEFPDEKIIVQGAVDLLFIEDGKIVIVDFKSDKNKNIDDLIYAYKEQLVIYSKACSKILKKPIGDLIIYSFELNKPIKL